jgi:hypothetical protein
LFPEPIAYPRACLVDLQLYRADPCAC